MTTNRPRLLGVTGDPNHPHLVGGTNDPQRNMHPVFDADAHHAAIQAMIVEYCPGCDDPRMADLPNHQPKLCWACIEDSKTGKRRAR